MGTPRGRPRGAAESLIGESVKQIWAIIPARGGSKGLPGKNLRPLGERPLLAWTVEAALRTPDLARVIVSTDCADIARVARERGAEVPFLRPRHLATDRASLASAVDFTVDQLTESEGEPDGVVVLYPTSPFRTSELLDRALESMRSYAQVSSCVPLDLVPAHWLVQSDGRSRPIGDRTDPVRLYYPTGSFTAFAYRPPELRGREATAEWRRELATRYGDDYSPAAAFLVVRDPLAAADIDDAADLARAAALLAGKGAPWPSPVSRLPFCVVGGHRIHPAVSLLGRRVALRVRLEPGARYILFLSGYRRDGSTGGEREFFEVALTTNGGLCCRPLFGGPVRLAARYDGKVLDLEVEPPAGADGAVLALAREPESDLCDFVKPFSLPPFWTFDPRVGRPRSLVTGQEIRGRQDGPRIVEASSGRLSPPPPSTAAHTRKGAAIRASDQA